MEAGCLFCRIVNGDLDADIVFENEWVSAFRDVNPQAPIHVLVVPKEHVATLNDLRGEHERMLSELMLAATRIARDQGVHESGYRLVVNCQEGAGQSVFHVHVHVLGGRPMNWPPG